MDDKDWKPADAQLTTAYLTVPDVVAALDFYSSAFGFERGEAMPHPNGVEGALAHASMKYLGTHVVMFGPEDLEWVEAVAPITSGAKEPVDMYLYNPDMDAMLAKAREAGAKVVKEPEEMFWGDRIAVVEDPFGYKWTLATKVGEFDPSKVPGNG